MKNNAYYPIVVVDAHQYSFISTGKRPIKKIVEFTHTGRGKIVNMAFGDLMPDGATNDTVNSNNGDLIMVLRTTVEVLKMYTVRFPDAQIFFTGSTEVRTKLYHRILKNYHHEFSKEFIISVLTKEGHQYIEKPYVPEEYALIIGFIIKRIS